MKHSLLETSILKELNLSIFPAIDKNQWKQLAEKQLKGGNPDKELVWENNSQMILEGYYDATDLADLKYLDDFFSKIPSHRWKLYEEIMVQDEKTANDQILKALMGGCDGVILKIVDASLPDAVLKDVDRTICDISIISDHSITIEGATGMQITPENNCIVMDQLNPVDQIAYVISQESQPHIYRAANPDFFLEIAAVRALKFLLSEYGRDEVLIHTHVPAHDSSDHQWFLNTTAGLASVLGGSHSIDFTTSFGDSRISRNTGNLIREESGIEEYTDQCRGSYYVEVLTDRIIQGVNDKVK